MNVVRHWISCNKFTVQVNTIDGMIVNAAPLVNKFRGQPVANLLKWAGKFGGLRHETW